MITRSSGSALTGPRKSAGSVSTGSASAWRSRLPRLAGDSTRDADNSLDFDLHAGHGESADLDKGARRTRAAEIFLTHRIDLRPVIDVGEIHGHLQHVFEACARSSQDVRHALEDPARLQRDVAAADEFSLPVERRQPGDEKQVAEPNGIGVMADRRVQGWNPKFLALGHPRHSFCS